MDSYDKHVKLALERAESGMHIQFIDPVFRTKEVCLAAVKANVDDLTLIPLGNLDYILSHIKDIKDIKDIKEIERLDDIVSTMKSKGLEPGYYGEFQSYQEKLNYYGAIDHDDMIRKIYLKSHS